MWLDWTAWLTFAVIIGTAIAMVAWVAIGEHRDRIAAARREQRRADMRRQRISRIAHQSYRDRANQAMWN